MVRDLFEAEMPSASFQSEAADGAVTDLNSASRGSPQLGTESQELIARKALRSPCSVTLHPGEVLLSGSPGKRHPTLRPRTFILASSPDSGAFLLPPQQDYKFSKDKTVPSPRNNGNA